MLFECDLAFITKIKYKYLHKLFNKYKKSYGSVKFIS
jgi:hypothetical protein